MQQAHHSKMEDPGSGLLFVRQYLLSQKGAGTCSFEDD